MPAERRQAGAPFFAEMTTDPGNGGPGFSVQAFAELAASVGQLATAVAAQEERARRMWHAVRPIPGIPLPQITTGSGIIDQPELLAPRTGYWWDVKWVTAATFTGG